MRGDFCAAKFEISPRIVTMSGFQAVNSNYGRTAQLPNDKYRYNFNEIYDMMALYFSGQQFFGKVRHL